MIVQVYFNLHKKCWSLRDKKTRRVIDHKQELVLTHCKFHVSEAGRQRVIREKRKNVHAWCEGWLQPDVVPRADFGLPVRYNPYEMMEFEMVGEPVDYSWQVHFFADRTVRAAV